MHRTAARGPAPTKPSGAGWTMVRTKTPTGNVAAVVQNGTGEGHFMLFVLSIDLKFAVLPLWCSEALT